MRGKKRIGLVNQKNPFLQIREQELCCTVDKVPGVSRGTVYALEYGVRKIVTRRVLLAYIQASQQYSEPNKLLHDYQRLYQHPITPVQEYRGKALNPQGICEDCGKFRPIVQNSAYTDRHICSACRIKAYNRDPAYLQQRREYNRVARGHIGHCEYCGRSTKYRCIRCEQIVCYYCSHTTGVYEPDGKNIRVCKQCVDAFNNS